MGFFVFSFGAVYILVYKRQSGGGGGVDHSGFAAEEIRRLLTLPEAACLWCGIGFSALKATIEPEPGHIYSFGYPALNEAFSALVIATDTGELRVALTEDGYPVRVEHRRINRDDLRAWLEQHHAHRPELLFGVPATHLTAGVSPQPLAGADAAGENIHRDVGALAPMLTARDIGQLFGITGGTLDNWIRERDFPAPLQVAAGASRRWDVAAVRAWKAANGA